MGELIKQETNDFRLETVPTGGYLDNLNQMGSNPDLWETAVFSTNDDTLSFRTRGGRPPFETFIPTSVNQEFKLLYGFYWSVTGHFFITLDPNLKTVADLKGKNLGLGFTGQSDWGMNPTLDLEFGYGITADNTTLKYIGPKLLAKALVDGEVDAIVAALGTGTDFKRWLPSKIFKELRRTRKKLYYIGHEPSVVDSLNRELGTSYIKVIIPAKTLPEQREPIHAFADRDYKASHVNFPEELAYKLVMLAATTGPKMMLTMNVWQTWSKEMMVAGLSEENAHPGAIRAFKELGWWELRKSFLVAELH